MAILPFVAAIKVLHIAENGDFENVGFLRKEFTNDTVMMNYTICHWFKLNFSAKRHSSIWVYATSWQLYNKGACKILIFFHFSQFFSTYEILQFLRH